MLPCGTSRERATPDRKRREGLFKSLMPSPVAMARKLGRLLFLCGLVGVVAGLGAIAFFWMLEFTRHYALGVIAGYYPVGPGGRNRCSPRRPRSFADGSFSSYRLWEGS